MDEPRALLFAVNPLFCENERCNSLSRLASATHALLKWSPNAPGLLRLSTAADFLSVGDEITPNLSYLLIGIANNISLAAS